MYTDRRRFQRLTLFIEVIYKVYQDYQKRVFLDDREIQAATLDISEGGIGLQTNQPIPEKSILDIVINITNLNKRGEIIFNKPIKVVGKVCWATPLQDNSYRIGIAFVEIDQKDKLLIRKFISKHSRTKEKQIIEDEAGSGHKYPRYPLPKK